MVIEGMEWMDTMDKLKWFNEKGQEQFKARVQISDEIRYKKDDKFGTTLGSKNKFFILVNEEDIQSKDFMRCSINRYVAKDNCIYGNEYKNIETSAVDFCLANPNALEFIVENAQEGQYKTVIEYLKMYFSYNDRNWCNMIRYITRILDVLNPCMIKMDKFDFNKEAEKILYDIAIKEKEMREK